MERISAICAELQNGRVLTFLIPVTAASIHPVDGSFLFDIKQFPSHCKPQKIVWKITDTRNADSEQRDPIS